VHAFAEEMNKSRRMVALQARALAAHNHAVMQWDLLGCGDSAGDFSDATWDAWLEDVMAACQLAQARFTSQWPNAAAPALWVWGQRAGALLAAQAVAALGAPWNLLLWQPATNGKAVLQQFLRLDSIGSLMGKASNKNTAKAELAAGRCAEVAGYVLAPALARGLGAALLQAPVMPSQSARLEWIEIGPRSGEGASPAAQPLLQSWAEAGWVVTHSSVMGPSFWQTTEIEEAPELLQATLAALRRGAPDSGKVSTTPALTETPA